ncbi:MAG: hypothetical protein FJ387_07795 [Verrucomicrobia bacterium]|nr:hypothetical protein [Verrucomicrobiota bacterium]
MACPVAALAGRPSAFLAQHRVSFTEVNVLTHPKAFLELRGPVRKALPIVVVRGEALGGCTQQRLAAALGVS